PHLPHDLALKLAKDVADVSVPMLESSSVLTERDLIDIVESSAEMVCRLAIAKREDVTEDVSQALVNTHEETVVNALVANQKAQISTAAIAQVVEEYSARDSVMVGLINRGGLPLTVAERMVSLVSDALKKDLVKRYKVSPYVLEDAVESTREWTTLGLMDPRASLNIAELVENLNTQKKLTPSLIIRSLCMGNLKFFEAAMAKRANIPAENARRLIMDKGHLGFRAMYKAAGMPPGVVDAVKTVVNLAYEETDNATRWPDDYPNRMIERILAGGHDQTVDNMPYLMAIIGRNIRIGGGLLSVDYTTEALPAA
ncbi:MAG: DUF2336 domain-containing protein, partial [Alphaproteobacteria bacterium]|nr:DUF2336 domain-containing protein [Alphaproteobacteria bacterium]